MDPGIWILRIIIFFLGASLGSFMGVILYRPPRGESVIRPFRSKCDLCKAQLGVIELIPVFGYIFSKGNCAYCGKKIPVRYFFWELLPAILFVLFFVGFEALFL